MSVSLLVRILWLRRALRGRERWSREELLAHQRRELGRLRDFACARSPFYQRLHRGLERAPLEELPVVTKADLMGSFDQVSTDPAVRLADLQQYLAVAGDEEVFAGRYSVSATSGSSGLRSVIPSNRQEWATVIASYARANEWSGIRAGLRRPTRLAVVSSTTVWHQSSRVATTVRSRFVDSERLDAGTPLPRLADRLNEIQPEVLVAYASMLRALAGEQMEGRLRIAPRAVSSSSEVLTSQVRDMVMRAWGVPPFDVYAATETGGIAAECDRHLGMHLFEDLVIPEVVDSHYRPVPDGQPGDRLLVTVLFSRTLPLIRYEMTDRVEVATHRCTCGRPFRLLAGVEGRTDDVLELPGARAGETVRVHPVVFHRALDLVEASGWQVRQEPGGLSVLIASPAQGFDPVGLERNLTEALASAGALLPAVRVCVVDAIPAGPTGKRPLVVAGTRPQAGTVG
ncbi:MAG: phenylacetate--CoA ligase family protein [Actinomycetota bacterium]